MAWNYRAHVRVDANHPDAAGICDRCGVRYNLADLRWQYEYRGLRLSNTRFRVCRRCMDVPDEHLRPIITPPDPVPVADPRPRYPNPQVPPYWDQPNLYWDGGYGAIPYKWDQQGEAPTMWDSPYPVPQVLGHAPGDSWDGMTIPEDVWEEWR